MTERISPLVGLPFSLWFFISQSVSFNKAISLLFSVAMWSSVCILFNLFLCQLKCFTSKDRVSIWREIHCEVFLFCLSFWNSICIFYQVLLLLVPPRNLGTKGGPMVFIITGSTSSTPGYMETDYIASVPLRWPPVTFPMEVERRSSLSWQQYTVNPWTIATHHSTDQNQLCLTSAIVRKVVFPS